MAQDVYLTGITTTGTPHLGPLYFFPNMSYATPMGIGWGRTSGPVAAFLTPGPPQRNTRRRRRLIP